MPIDRGRARQRNRNTVSPETLLESHLQKLLKEQELLHQLLISNRPGKTQLENLGGESIYEIDDENLPCFQEAVGEERKELNNHPILAEMVDSPSPSKLEDLPKLPSRRYPYRRNQSLIPTPISVGNCTQPKLMGQGFDTPFLYPDFISQNEENRVKYLFSLVDSLVLQTERIFKLSEHSMAKENIKNPSTGAIPKSRPKQEFQIDQMGHAKYTITVKSRFKEPKQHNPSKKHRLAKSKINSYNKLPDIIDLDCEFGMEYIEKFRANNIRDENKAEGVSDTGQDIYTDATDSIEIVTEDEEGVNESLITVIPNSEYRNDTSFLEIEMAKSFKKQRKCKKKDTNVYRPTTDLDCEFGMEYIEKFRANKIRDENKAEGVSDTGQDIYTDATDSIEIVTEDEEGYFGVNESLITVIPNSEYRKSFKTQRKCKKKDTNVYRPTTPITRPSTPIDDDVPSTSAHAKFYQQFKDPLDPEKSESSVLNMWQLLTAKEFNREKRRQQQAQKYKYGKLQPLDPKSVMKPKQKSVSIKRPNMCSKFCSEYKTKKEWLKAERKFKRDQYLSFYRPQDLSEPRIKLTEEVQCNIQRRLFNVISNQTKPVQPKPMPKINIPHRPVEEKKVPKQVPDKGTTSLDRGEWLKNLLIDRVRLSRQKHNMDHLIPPENPLKAIYLPILRQVEPLKIYQKKPKPLKKKPTSFGLKISSTNYMTPEPGSQASLATIFYDAKHTMSRTPSSTALRDDLVDETESVFSCQEPSDPHIFSSLSKIEEIQPLQKKIDRSTTEDISKEIVDFRKFIDIDCVSLLILHLMSNMKPKKDIHLFEFNPKITNYMDYFYWKHLKDDCLFFHWFVSEGFFPAHYLINVKNSKELENVSDEQIDEEIMQYIDVANDACKKEIHLTRQMAHLMVTSYFRVLHHRATSVEYPIQDRYLLRCRSAISVVELYQQERGRNILKNRVDCKRLMNWAIKHEGRVKQLIDEPLYYAEQRANIDSSLVIRTPNLECFKDFYTRHVLPKPDALAINSMFNKMRYPRNRTYPHMSFVCPIPGCETILCSEILMAHYLSDHCRRLEELWLTDRMILLFYPCSYPTNQIYCICVIALLAKIPGQTVPVPRVVINEELPTKYLYFAEHGACFLMFAPVSRLLVEGKVTPKPSAGIGVEKQQLDTLYIFWLAIADYELEVAGCRLLVYGRNRSVKARSLLTFVKMSTFKGVNDLLVTHPDSYLAIDYETMATVTNNFKELIFIEVRYINKLNEDPNSSGDDNYDD
ncbi:uncharacterized protein LOC6618989 isoform X2 [Drosophila sechellia]|uniref:uncharacterized protein LOC6618989 isoform X2 n=1 Tax=Drosophila sechellia TaxID=7238 RepID=UPI0013DDA224|nr:uncharacterized protein LOC6618989 isoform X2 [Drosophila sechellia]